MLASQSSSQSARPADRDRFWGQAGNLQSCDWQIDGSGLICLCVALFKCLFLLLIFHLKSLSIIAVSFDFPPFFFGRGKLRTWHHLANFPQAAADANHNLRLAERCSWAAEHLSASEGWVQVKFVSDYSYAPCGSFGAPHETQLNLFPNQKSATFPQLSAMSPRMHFICVLRLNQVNFYS